MLDSPRLGSPQETYAQVVIAANDNPNGVLELSSAEVFVEENHSGTLISVVRSAGDFGQVLFNLVFLFNIVFYLSESHGFISCFVI